MKIYKYEKTWSLIIILIVISLAKDALYLPPCGYVASVSSLPVTSKHSPVNLSHRQEPEPELNIQTTRMQVGTNMS